MRAPRVHWTSKLVRRDDARVNATLMATWLASHPDRAIAGAWSLMLDAGVWLELRDQALAVA